MARKRLVYEAFNGLDLEDLHVRRKLDTSSMGWSGNIPLDIEREYSQRWTGKILADDTGTYEFTAITDGSLRLWFGGKLMIDEWTNREEKRFAFSTKLAAGRKYDIKLEHQQFKMKQAVMRLNWHTPAMKKYEAVKSLPVYFPPASTWYDFWTGKTVRGGKTIAIKPALDSMPLFVPAGSLIPLGPRMQHTAEKKADPIELRIYTGRDCEFTLYEDEGDNYNYEKGAYSIIPFTWNDKEKKLTIGPCGGRFPGMLSLRTFQVVIVKTGHGVGLDETKKPDKIVRYTGKKIRVKIGK